MNINELRQMELAKYWSLPNGENYKTKFKKALQKNEYILTKKMDGALYRYSSSDENAILQSRTISQTTGVLVEKQDNVPEIMKALSILPKNTMLIGEICFIDQSLSSKDVVSIMGCLPQKAIERQQKTPVAYYIFDIMCYSGMEIHNMPYSKRIALIQKISKQYSWSENILFAQPIEENIEETLAEWLAQGYEGGMLMHKDKPYVFGKRPAWNSIKIKQELGEDLDLIIMDFTKPIEDYTGKYPQGWKYWKNLKTGELAEGTFYSSGGYKPVSENYFLNKIGGLVLGAYLNDKIIQVCKVSNLTDSLREKITNDPKSFLNMVVKVQAMSIDKENRSLRHPKFIDFHIDKNPQECLYEDIFS